MHFLIGHFKFTGSTSHCHFNFDIVKSSYKKTKKLSENILQKLKCFKLSRDASKSRDIQLTGLFKPDIGRVVTKITGLVTKKHGGLVGEKKHYSGKILEKSEDRTKRTGGKGRKRDEGVRGSL